MGALKFKARRRQAAEQKEPVPFDVDYEVEVPKLDDAGDPEYSDGRPVMVVEERVETFTCRGEVHSLMLSRLASLGDLDVHDAADAAVISDTFKSAFGDDREYQRFYKFAEKHLDEEDLGEIFEGVMEAFSARPTTRPAGSVDSPPASGADSKVVSLPGGYAVASGA